MSIIFKYDGTFEGFLTSVFTAYQRKCDTPKIVRFDRAMASFFEESETIYTDTKKAERVWKGLQKKCSTKGLSNLFRAFLSEKEEIESLLFSFIKISLKSTKPIDGDFSNPVVLNISKTVKMVNREKHRMDAFIRFKLTKEDIYFATIEPDFNVLPLNIKHFKNRYADQKWLIYDLRRNYGVFYNLKKTTIVEIDFDKDISKPSKSDLFFTQDEFDYEDLWKNYFKSTNIKSRKNMKLHLRHVPKRYWKYLSEKQPI